MLLGVDLGTTAVKVTAWRPGAGVAGRAGTPVTTIRGRPGEYEQDPETWWTAVRSALAALAADGVDLGAVTAVGLSGHTHGLVLVDEALEPVRPCLTWADQRATAETRELGERVGALVSQRCANPLIEAFTLPKLAWVARHEPATLAAAAQLGLPKDYLRARLTGTWATDATDAASTLFYDLRRQAWDEELLAAAGAGPDLLPEVLAPAAVAGVVTRAAAEQTGLPAGVPVAAGASDVACAALGAGADEPGVTCVNVGTAAQILTPMGEPVSGQHYVFQGAGQQPFLAMASVYSAGLALQWCMDRLLRGPLGSSADSDEERYRVVTEAVLGVPPGAGGLLFLPYLLGSSTPFHDPAARGALLGMTPGHGQAEALRAVIEGVALAIGLALGELPAGVAPKRLRAGGGAARSPAWTRILAAACGCDVEVLAAEGSGMGAVMLAGLATSQFPGPREAAAACVAVRETVPADEDAVRVYRDRAEVFRAAYEALAPVFPRLAGTPAPGDGEG